MMQALALSPLKGHYPWIMKVLLPALMWVVAFLGPHCPHRQGTSPFGSKGGLADDGGVI